MKKKRESTRVVYSTSVRTVRWVIISLYLINMVNLYQFCLMMLFKFLILCSNCSGRAPANVKVGTRRKSMFSMYEILLHRPRLPLKVMRQ